MLKASVVALPESLVLERSKRLGEKEPMWYSKEERLEQRPHILEECMEKEADLPSVVRSREEPLLPAGASTLAPASESSGDWGFLAPLFAGQWCP